MPLQLYVPISVHLIWTQCCGDPDPHHFDKPAPDQSDAETSVSDPYTFDTDPDPAF